MCCACGRVLRLMLCAAALAVEAPASDSIYCMPPGRGSKPIAGAIMVLGVVAISACLWREVSQRKCRPGRHPGGEVVHLANPTSVTCSAYRDNDDCALCNRLWYCLDGFAVVASGKPPLWKP